VCARLSELVLGTRRARDLGQPVGLLLSGTGASLAALVTLSSVCRSSSSVMAGIHGKQCNSPGARRSHCAA